jgi:hypothetical protein
MAEATLTFKGVPPKVVPKPEEKLPVVPPEQAKAPIAQAVSATSGKPVHAHKLFAALFKFAAKKYPQIADELELDQNDKDLLDEAFSPVFKKFFASIGVGDDYINVIIAVIIVLAPRVVLIIGEVRQPKPADKPKGEGKPPEPVRAAPEQPPAAVTPAGASGWTWGKK